MKVSVNYLIIVLVTSVFLIFLGCATAVYEEQVSEEALPIASEIKEGGYFRLSFTSDTQKAFSVCLDPEGIIADPVATACENASAQPQRQPAEAKESIFYRIRYYNDKGQLLGETCYKDHFMVDPKTSQCAQAHLHERFYNTEVANQSFRLFQETCYNRFNQIVDKAKCQSST